MPGETLGPILPGFISGGGGGGSITLIQNLDGTITVLNGAGPTVTVSLPSIVTPGTVGDASHVGQVTVDATGRVTAGSNVSIQIAESQVTNLVSDLAGKQAGPLTGDVTTVGAAATLVGTANVESIIRANSLNQMAAPTAGVNWNNQNITQLASVSMTDGTNAHGNITLALNAPLQNFYVANGDTQPAAQLGVVSASGVLNLGPGGSTAPDATITRPSAAIMALTAANGIQINPNLTATFTSQPTSTLGILINTSYTLNFASATIGNLVDFKPTVIFQQAGFALSSGTGFNFEPTVKNLAGNNVGIGLFTAIAFNPTFTADTTTITNMGTAIGFVASPTTNVVSGGVISAMTLQGFRSQASVGASTSVSTLTHFLANAAGGAGAANITLQLGLDIGAMTTSTTNVGIRNASPTAWTPSANQTLAAATVINPNATAIQVIQTSGANITLTGAPTITSPTTSADNGKIIHITNVSTVAGSTFTFQSVSSLAGSTLSLGATTRVVGLKGSLTLQWNNTLTRWVEIGFNTGGFG